MSAVMPAVFPERVDWAKLLDDLRDAGWSGYAVAQALGRSWDTVQGWRKHEPKHSDGEALKAIHAKYCSKCKWPDCPSIFNCEGGRGYPCCKLKAR